ncbi:MAG: hypothetical protein ACRDPL_09550, partial [Propionibacteriaceae bacterium]
MAIARPTLIIFVTERRLDRHKWAWSTGTAPPSKALDSLSYLDLVASGEDSLVEQRPATWVSLQVGRAGDHPKREQAGDHQNVNKRE